MAYEGVVLKNPILPFEKELAQEWSQNIRVHLGYLSVRYNDLGYWIRIASISTGSSPNISPTKPYKDNAIDT